MGLPKNFNEKVNRPKIVESLNDLNFYTTEFVIEIIKDSSNKERQQYDLLHDTLNADYNVLSREGDMLVCSKNYSALNDETALRKLTEWLEIKKNNEEIVSYEIKELKSNSFYEELDKKGLLDLLYFNKQ
jgi:hypothetical protein